MEVEFMIRLDKFLSEMGVGTRQEVKQYIRKGKVEVDGEIAKRPELKVDETKANVTLDGERIGYASYVYYMLNKPSGGSLSSKASADRWSRSAGCEKLL